MRHVNLDSFKPRIDAAARRFNKLRGDLFDIFASQLALTFVSFPERNRTGRERLPATFAGMQEAATAPRYISRSFASGVRKLNRRYGVLRLDECGDWLESFRMCAGPNAGIARRDATLGRNCGSFDTDHRCTADGATAEVDQVPVSRHSVLARVLAHRRNDDAILERQCSECEWRK